MLRAPLVALVVAVGTLAGPVRAPVAAATDPVAVAVPGVVMPLDAVTVPGGAIWIARGAAVVKFVPGSTPQTITLPSGLNARRFALGPDGTLWFGGLAGSLGTIAADGTVTARMLADPNADIASLAVGRDGALWVLAASTLGLTNHLERGAPGGPMTAVPLPSNTRYDLVAAGGSGAVIAIGNDDASIAADGTITPLAGIPNGTSTDLTTIGTETWATTTGGMAVIDAANAVTAYPASTGVPGGIPASITAGGNGRAWYTAGSASGGTTYLGHVGADGPDGATVLTASPTSTTSMGAIHLVADPSATRLWAVGFGSDQVLVTPVDIAKHRSTVSVDQPGPMTFGTPTTVRARVTAWGDDPAPTGTVTFSSEGTVLGTATVQADGTATATVSPTPHRMILAARYSGDAEHLPELGLATIAFVTDIETTTTITAPQQPWRPGSFTYQITVTSPSGPVPSGLVEIGSQRLAVSGGQPTSFTTTLPLGGYPSLYVTFVPDPGFAGSTASFSGPAARWDTDEENYVAAAYLRLFGRNADPSGRVFWANRIRSGLSRDQFAVAQVSTSEYRRTVAKRVGLVPGSATPAQAKPMVDAMAKSTVRNLLIEKWAAAKTVTDCRDTIAPTFAPPGSFMCWVKVIFTTYKGSATADDYAWASRYGNTLQGRRAIAKSLVYSDTAVRPVVEAAYRSYLNRAPDPSGWAYWTKKIQAGLREERVEAMVLGSDEFFRRTLLPAPA